MIVSVTLLRERFEPQGMFCNRRQEIAHKNSYEYNEDIRLDKEPIRNRSQCTYPSFRYRILQGDDGS